MGRCDPSGIWRVLPEVRESEEHMDYGCGWNSIYYREEERGALNDWTLGTVQFMLLERNDFNALARRCLKIANTNRCFTVVAGLAVRLERQDNRPFRVFAGEMVKAETQDVSAAVAEFLKLVREL